MASRNALGSICPACFANKGQIRFGKNRSGSRRAKCNDCGSYYTPTPKFRTRVAKMAKAIDLYEKTGSFRAVSRELKVHHQSVINWVRAWQAWQNESSKTPVRK